MDLLLQTFDLSLEVFLFFGVVLAHHPADRLHCPRKCGGKDGQALRSASQPVPAAFNTAAAIPRSVYEAFVPFQNRSKTDFQCSPHQKLL